MWTALAALPLWCILLTNALAQDASTLFQPKVGALSPMVGTNYYGVYFGSNKVGWASHRQSLAELSDSETFLSQMEMELEFVQNGNPLEMNYEMKEWFAAEAPHPFLRGEDRIDTNGEISATKLERTKTAFKLLRSRNDRPEAREIPVHDYRLSDYLAADLYFRSPRKVNDSFTARAINLQQGDLAQEKHTVKSIRKTNVQGTSVTLYEVQSVIPRDGLTSTYTIDQNGRLVEAKLMDLLALRLEPKTIAKQKLAIFNFKTGAIKASLPLGDPKSVTHLEVSIKGDYQGLIEPSSFQRVTYDPEQNRTKIQIGSARHDHPLVPKSEWETYLRATPRYPIRDRRVLELANKATEGVLGQREKSDAIVHFVHRFMNYEVDFADRDILSVIQDRKGDCSEAALLFVALARANGLPAREASGLVYADNATRRFELHAWAEVLLDGRWHAVDPTWDETTINPTHIQFETSLHDGADPVASGFSLLKLLTRQDATTIRIDRVESKF